MSKEPSTERGAVTWHSSDKDSGPDVGLSMGLGDGELLWIGELPEKSGWHLAIYHSTAGREDIAQFLDAETARTFFEALEKLAVQPAAEIQRLEATRARQVRTITSLEAEARQSAAAREAQHQEIGRLRRAIREIEELATDTPDEATQEGALDSIRSCCEGALVAEQENPNANR